MGRGAAGPWALPTDLQGAQDSKGVGMCQGTPPALSGKPSCPRRQEHMRLRASAPERLGGQWYQEPDLEAGCADCGRRERKGPRRTISL